jgi:hypothetical protein
VLRDEDVDELVMQPDGAMENTNKRRCVMQSRVVLGEVVTEEGGGGRSEEEWLLNRCRKPRFPSTLIVDSVVLGLA